jgi:hypothetical protein
MSGLTGKVWICEGAEGSYVNDVSRMWSADGGRDALGSQFVIQKSETAQD